MTQILHINSGMIRAVLFIFVFILMITALVLFFYFLSFTDPLNMIVCFIICFAGNVLILFLIFHPRNQWLVANQSQVQSPGTRLCISLTFDDGPSANNTDRLLRILKEKGIKATFFVIGRKVEADAEMAQRVCAEGHILGNHTYSHPSLFCFLSPRRLKEEIEKGQEAITRVCGVSPRYFRSPVGLRHPLLGVYLKRAQLEYISWRCRAFDTFTQEAETIMKRILNKVAPGDIILLHDDSRESVGKMLDVFPELIDALIGRGFEFVSVGECPAEPRAIPTDS